jgi:hypothetical protein
MSPARLAALAAALLVHGVVDAPAAWAQVPPHKPGTICFTPKFWCWATPPGKPGARCICASPYGPIAGTLN